MILLAIIFVVFGILGFVLSRTRALIGYGLLGWATVALVGTHWLGALTLAGLGWVLIVSADNRRSEA